LNNGIHQKLLVFPYASTLADLVPKPVIDAPTNLPSQTHRTTPSSSCQEPQSVTDETPNQCTVLSVLSLWKTYGGRKRPPFQDKLCFIGQIGHMARACNKKKENDARPRTCHIAPLPPRGSPLDEE